MDEELKDYLRDNGFRSRKLWVTVLVIILIASMGIAWAVWDLKESIFDTVTNGLVTLTIGFLGITAGRAAIPATAAFMSRDTEQEQSHEQR